VTVCNVTRFGSCWRPAALLALSSLLLTPGRAAAAESAEVPTARVSVAALLRQSSRLAAWLASHSPEIHAARARVAQSRADVRTSHLLQNPVLDASLANVPVSETNPPGLSFNETAIYTVGLSETVELGKRGPRIAGAELRQKSASLQLIAAERDHHASRSATRCIAAYASQSSRSHSRTPRARPIWSARATNKRRSAAPSTTDCCST
jgi:hypothetical protein